MKKLLTSTFFLLIISTGLISQEFNIFDNGLIYPQESMNKLKSIVDSLNLQYKICEFDKAYYSKNQTFAHFFKLSGKDAEKLKNDIKSNIPFDKLTDKYKDLTLKKNICVILEEDIDFDDVESIIITEINLIDGYGHQVSFPKPKNFLPSSIISEYHYSFSPKTDYYDAYISGFYIPNKFEKKIIPEKYAKMIGYADCLIDTTSTKINPDADYGFVHIPENYKELSFSEKSELLNNLRNVKVVGTCSQDSSPRIHAVNIAKLAAETTNWEVFLKAHLDVMNDRFDRASDGSYAWSKRLTYIKELEMLKINNIDLLLGISFRIDNPAQHHYFGSIRRLGRAISESEISSEFEKIIVSIISDSSLDYYNRVLFFFLFENYNSYLDPDKKNENNIVLEELKSQFPINMR